MNKTSFQGVWNPPPFKDIKPTKTEKGCVLCGGSGKRLIHHPKYESYAMDCECTQSADEATPARAEGCGAPLFYDDDEWVCGAKSPSHATLFCKRCDPVNGVTYSPSPDEVLARADNTEHTEP